MLLTAYSRSPHRPAGVENAQDLTLVLAPCWTRWVLPCGPGGPSNWSFSKDFPLSFCLLLGPGKNSDVTGRIDHIIALYGVSLALNLSVRILGVTIDQIYPLTHIPECFIFKTKQGLGKHWCRMMLENLFVHVLPPGWPNNFLRPRIQLI